MEKKTPVSVFIAEDRQSSLDLLIEYMLFRKELKLEGVAKNGEEAFKMLSKKKYDLIFLDINLPLLSGIEVLERLNNIPYVIFTTAFDKYAIRAFEVGAVDYLLKPFSMERFNQAVDRALKIITDKNKYIKSSKILGMSFKCNRKNYIVPFEDIVYVSSSSRYSVISTNDEEFETPILLKEVGQKLPEGFLRIHKQYIVNLKYVFKVEHLIGGQYEITLNDDNKTDLPVGRTYYDNLKKRLNI
jgi:DNA-binding LytR/AlgR family response regulator